MTKHRCICRRKKVVRKHGKRYYRMGRSGLKLLRGNAKPPRLRKR